MSRRQKPLHLHEEIMLLALRDEEGTVEFGSMYGYSLGGAILAELLLAGRPDRCEWLCSHHARRQLEKILEGKLT